MCGLVTLVILALGGALAWQNLREPPHRPPRSAEERRDEALRILERRYAAGEISRQEFQERRHTILGGP